MQSAALSSDILSSYYKNNDYFTVHSKVSVQIRGFSQTNQPRNQLTNEHVT